MRAACSGRYHACLRTAGAARPKKELGRGRFVPGFYFRRAVNGYADALIGPAAADISAHEVVDVGIGGIWLLGKKGGRGHDLPALTIATLWNVKFNPSLLDRMISFLG